MLNATLDFYYDFTAPSNGIDKKLNQQDNFSSAELKAVGKIIGWAGCVVHPSVNIFS